MDEYNYEGGSGIGLPKSTNFIFARNPNYKSEINIISYGKMACKIRTRFL